MREMTEEFMIGDWIIDDNNYAKVTGLDDVFGISTSYSGFRSRTTRLPIPLSLKILEVNGFERTSECEEFNCVTWSLNAGSVFIHVSCIDETYQITVDLVSDEYKRGFMDIIRNLEIKYVHQLQHICRFVGLRKFANGFIIEKQV